MLPGHNQLAGRIGMVRVLSARLLESCSSGKTLVFEPPPPSHEVYDTVTDTQKSCDLKDSTGSVRGFEEQALL